ncbi:MAG: tetratricopeptide repeat protein, partial [Gemmatimonadetes bacterium]|nr:tetratricopeptide repeat protein [Gemmatimonadota bacterium]
TQIARAEGLQSKFDDAGATLARVLAVGGALSPRAGIRYELEKGRLLNSSGDAEKSRAHFERALALAEQSGEEFFAIDAAHMMGIVAPPDAQLDWNERALAMAGASDNPVARKWIGSLYNNIGYTYMEQGEYELALVNFRKLQEFCAETGNESFGAVARWFTGKTYRLQGKTEKALAVQQELLAAEEEAGAAGAFTLEEIAECHLALGGEEQARRYFLLTHEALHGDEQYKWVLDSDKERVARIRELAGLPD